MKTKVNLKRAVEKHRKVREALRKEVKRIKEEQEKATPKEE